jgi:ubiquinone/menaquinone biosynthesis C-methylase UbiE
MEKKSHYEQAGVAMTCRSYAEYVSMFALEEEILRGKRVLDVAGGASSFTTEARRRGIEAEAADPLYIKSLEEIAKQGKQEIIVSTAKLAGLQHIYNWDYYGNIERHQAGREQSLALFLEDYANEGSDSRYHASMLPELPFLEGTFSLTLCSHFLFLYEEQFDVVFHLAALRELLRVCEAGGEVRVYPIMNFRTERYSGMEELVKALEEDGNQVEFLESKLPFLPNSDRLLCIRKAFLRK